MGKLKARTKRISLEFMGDAWKDACVEFRALTWADAQKLQVDDMNDRQANTALYGLLKELFVSGKSVGENDELVELEAADIEEFDIETVAQVTTQLAGTPSPNA